MRAVRAAARGAAVVWLCNPNNPTGRLEPDGLIEGLLDDLAADAAAAGRPAPVVVLDEAYSEFVGRSLVDLRASYPRLIVVRTVSKAYALAGLRVGFAIARRETLARIEPYRPPGSVSTVSVSIATEILDDPQSLSDNLARVGRGTNPAGRWAARGRLAARAERHELPARPVREPRGCGPGRRMRCCGPASCRARSRPTTRSRTASA